MWTSVLLQHRYQNIFKERYRLRDGATARLIVAHSVVNFTYLVKVNSLLLLIARSATPLLHFPRMRTPASGAFPARRSGPPPSPPTAPSSSPPKNTSGPCRNETSREEAPRPHTAESSLKNSPRRGRCLQPPRQQKRHPRVSSHELDSLAFSSGIRQPGELKAQNMNAYVKAKLEDLGHHLKVKFKLPPNRPTLDEVVRIIQDVEQLPLASRTDAAWRTIVYNHVKFEGHYVYEGLDLSDINDLQSQIIALLD